MSEMTTNPIERKSEILENGCWRWIGHIRKQDGYGYTTQRIRHRKYRYVMAHVLSYEQYVGIVPAGWIVHHKCENRWCVNPDHLQAMTISEHRREHTDEQSFPCGHPRTEENTRPNRKEAACRRCHLEYMRRYHETHPKRLRA